METRRLRLLLALSRLGSMRAVAAELGYTTSTVSQQLAVLAGEAGVPLIEREGRRVRLTPAGRRLAAHAETILAAVEAARADLDPAAEPTGTVRVAAFASAIRRALVPAARALPAEHPGVRLAVHEHEPDEAFALLAADEVDLAVVYDYDLAPLEMPPGLHVVALWSTPWGLAVPEGASAPGGEPSPAVFRRFAGGGWIVDSRNTADEEALRLIASLAGFEPDIAHSVDSLELVEELILAGLGVGLLPADRPTATGVGLIELRDPSVTLRAFAATRRGRENWPPLALMLERLAEVAGATPLRPGRGGPRR